MNGETDTVTIPAPAQASAQVLDVGDRVTVVGWPGTEYVVLRQKPSGRYHLCQPVDSAEGWQHRDALVRVGGDLHPGDWVRVTGQLEWTSTPDVDTITNQLGMIVGRFSTGYRAEFVVYVLSEGRSYEANTDQLTRITRAEALA